MNSQKDRVPLPKVGLFACFSGGSNTGSLAGMAALEVVRRLGSDVVGVCSLPAVLNKVPRQSAMVNNIETIVVIDGCHQECARELLDRVGVEPAIYLNIERDLGIQKLGPFTSLSFTEEQVNAVASALVRAIESILQRREEGGKR
ncbi:MAG: putative zinc-binding protein [Anaerolineae bacterium]